jgi:signal transduction histidine kinase
MVAVSIAVGWFAAGRALRPVAHITAVARSIGDGNLATRIGLGGPRDELRELAETFDGMLGRLDAAFATQRRFAANASHELRTPLAVLRAQLEGTLNDPESGEAEFRSMSSAALDAIERIQAIIEGLLTLTRSERAPERRHAADLAELVEANLDPLREDIARRELTVSLDLQSAETSGTPVLLERAVANLLGNAVVHNHPGGHISVSTKPVDGRVLLSVANTGDVVSQEEATRLFEPFHRLDASRSRETGGIGLGLSIVKGVVAAHDGAAEILARPGGGLVVNVLLPHRATRLTSPGA